MKLYLMSRYGQEKVNDCYQQIQELIIKCLQSVAKTIINDKHCFELYGFDVLLDEQLKPWLIEINASPSMTANTPTDYETKMGLLEDCFTILDPEKILTGFEEQVGGFDLICKGNPVKPNFVSQYTNHLGCFNNRQQQLKKLAKVTAARLAQNYAHQQQQQHQGAGGQPISGAGDMLKRVA